MNICVYCGSSLGNDPKIAAEAHEFGKTMAQNGHRLIYGGAAIGIMGTLADAVMQYGGEVIGVMPKDLFKKEVGHQGITRLISVDDMHERKSTMAELADAFVALPGGFGTLEELFEIITWNQIGILDKPVILFNHTGFYNSLIEMIDHSVSAGFIRKENRQILKVAETMDECFGLINENN